MTNLSEVQAGEKLAALVKSFRTAMLTTHGVDGLRSRPMTIVYDDAVDAPATSAPQIITFVTSKHSPYLADFDKDPEVCISAQNGEKSEKAGEHAEVSRATLDKLAVNRR